MSKKILNLFVCILLLLPAFSVIGSSNHFNNEIKKIDMGLTNNNMTITLKPILFFLGVNAFINVISF